MEGACGRLGLDVLPGHVGVVVPAELMGDRLLHPDDDRAEHDLGLGQDSLARYRKEREIVAVAEPRDVRRGAAVDGLGAVEAARIAHDELDAGCLLEVGEERLDVLDLGPGHDSEDV